MRRQERTYFIPLPAASEYRCFAKCDRICRFSGDVYACQPPRHWLIMRREIGGPFSNKWILNGMNKAAPPHDEFYFAYGSNLNLGELKAVCADAGLDGDAVEPVAAAWLPDMSLVFDYYSTSRGGGALNVRTVKGSLVSGYLLRLSPDAWRLIDRKEGHPAYYRRTSVTVLVEGGAYVPAATYIVTPERAQCFVPPTQDYLAICEDGRRQLGVETRSLRRASEGQGASLLDSLFCYGTLMRGESRFPAIASKRLRCALLAQTPGRLLDCGTYPGLLPDVDTDVQGDFFRSRRISDLLDELDWIEGFAGFGGSDNLFRRTIRPVHVGDGRVRYAWVYLVCDDSHPGLAVTDWRAVRGTCEEARERILDCHTAACSDLFSRLTERRDRYSAVPDEQRTPLDRNMVLEGMRTGHISERRLAQSSGLWAAGAQGW